jgi:MFS family permease
VRTRHAVWVLAGGIVVMQVGGGLTSPLYPLYERWWGIGPATVVQLFVVFVASSAAGLLVVARAADRVQRRRLLVALASLSAVAAAGYGLATGPAWVLIANIAQGVAIGAFISIAAAEMQTGQPPGDGRFVGRVASSSTAVGLAVGPLWSGLLLQTSLWPGRLVFLVQGLVTLALLALLYRLPGRRDARPRPALPRTTIGSTRRERRRLGLAAIGGFCAFALGAVATSLGPLIAVDELHVTVPVVSALPPTLIFAANAVVSVFPLRSASTTVRGGLLTAAAGSGMLLTTGWLGSLAVFLLCMVVIGCAQGALMKSCTAIVLESSPVERRGRDMSAFFFASYLGTALALLGVSAVTRLTGLGTAVAVFGAAIAGLSLVHGVVLAPRLYATASDV